MIHHWKQFIETFQTVDVWRISYKMYLKLFEKWPSISLLVLDKCLTDVGIRIWELKFISPIGPILSSEVKKTHYIPWTCYVALNTIDLYRLDHMCKCIVVKSQFWIKFGPQIQKILIDENFIIHLEVYNVLLYMIQPQYVVYYMYSQDAVKKGEKKDVLFLGFQSQPWVAILFLSSISFCTLREKPFVWTLCFIFDTYVLIIHIQ